jgi:hypothetical protein
MTDLLRDPTADIRRRWTGQPIAPEDSFMTDYERGILAAARADITTLLALLDELTQDPERVPPGTPVAVADLCEGYDYTMSAAGEDTYVRVINAEPGVITFDYYRNEDDAHPTGDRWAITVAEAEQYAWTTR